MTKFTAGIFLICFVPFFIYKKIRFKEGLVFMAGFSVFVLPYFVFNQFYYGNAFFPLLHANQVISKVLSCNYLRYNNWLFYFRMLVLDNILNIFILLGIFFSVKSLDRKKIVLLACFLIPFVYHTQLNCRIYRYMILFLPFISILAGKGISSSIRRCSKKWLYPVLISILIISSYFGIAYYTKSDLNPENEKGIEYLAFLDGIETNGEIWTSNPLLSIFTDSRLNKIYYPVYNDGLSSYFLDYLSTNYSSIEYVFLDNCGGGIICPPDNNACLENLQKTMEYLNHNFDIVFNESYGRCYYRIYRNKLF